MSLSARSQESYGPKLCSQVGGCAGKVQLGDHVGSVGVALFTVPGVLFILYYGYNNTDFVVVNTWYPLSLHINAKGEMNCPPTIYDPLFLTIF